ncbi:alpha/beta hydrolase [Bacillus sp. J14TS2]|uniref:alpha/beta fold hydrolase n=1 Tax=Bacillus sp. J14TS2 TaxID=2807188 RepID=UPI001B2EB2F3|nr:alpha/beta hydrolase [Bacillus sp. J14TS2]GIN71906.1 alpha/beta hydrolase [Bacillus sp. J14TS2]
MNKTISVQRKEVLDIEGIKLYYEYFGKGHNTPTIVCDSGYGYTLANWQLIQDEVSQLAKIFIYDRDGLGKSDKSGRPRHSEQIVENLHKLLQKASIPPPYILVGHSFGGVNVRLYAHAYPEEVVGIILLDSCHQDQNEKVVPLFKENVQRDYYNQFTEEGTLCEFEESLKQVRNAQSLGSTPLVVLSAGSQPHHTKESLSAWMSLQEELVKLSKKGEQIIVENAGHNIHIDCPQVVIDTIKSMLETVSDQP